MEDTPVAVFIHGCVVGQNCEGVCFLGWGGSPTHDWSQRPDCWHETGLGAPVEVFFPDAPNNQKEDSSEKLAAALESPIPINLSACL